ncbi:MAG: DUF1926 domain-containing protein [Treponema sp.]|nr:DUF1926 domain-containing protein [Treponema sp.]
MSDVKLSLILISHAHVPYGAETGEFEKMYTNLVVPFVSGLYRYPRIQAVIHYSGVLLHWIERSHPELFMLLEDMVARKQIEMLGGGFYEPMLPIIPQQDKIGQIELMTTYLRKQFGKRPQGCWIPEYAWEQSLVSPLAACGMGYTFLSERQFALAGGITSANPAGIPAGIAPCICEDQGKLITVFPVMQSLEEAFAGKGISDSLLVLQDSLGKKRHAENEMIISVFPKKISAKSAESPDYAWGRFFEEISLCDTFVETVSPGKLYRNLKCLQKRCFSDSTGVENGISPRRFIIMHPEAGRIYSKMIFTNVLINQLRGDKSRKLSAHEELWKAQGSTLFCSTGKQGLHNHTLRNASYSALLGAERVTREKGKFNPMLVSYDFNMDGTEEWLFQDSRINCYVQSTGGGIFELDYLPKSWNYLDSCHGRTAFSDRLLPSGTKIENLCIGNVSKSRKCCEEQYDLDEMDKVRRILRLVLRPNAATLGGSKTPVPFGRIEIKKCFQVKKDTVLAGYSLSNRGTEPEDFCFAPEIDLAFPGEGSAFTRFFACKPGNQDTQLAQPQVRLGDGVKIHDLKNEIQITLTVNRSFDINILPVHIPGTKSNESLFQSLCAMPLFPVSLKPEESWDVEFTLKFTH